MPVPGDRGEPDRPAAFVPVAKGWERRETKLIDAADMEKLRAGGWVVGPAGRRFAFRRSDPSDSDSDIWMVDGKPMGTKFPYDATDPLLAFSGDEKRVVTAAGYSGNIAVHIDGKPLDGKNLPPEVKDEGGKLLKNPFQKVVVTRDGGQPIVWCWRAANVGERLAMDSDWSGGPSFPQAGTLFRLGDEVRWLRLVEGDKANLNGREVTVHKERDGAVFARQGTGFAYVAKQDGQFFVVHNGTPSKRFDKINSLFNHQRSINSPSQLIALSDDGLHYAAFATDGDKHYVLYDNTRHELPGRHWGLTLSPDGKRWASRGYDSGEVMVDGKPVKSPLNRTAQRDGASRQCGVFSPDGREFAFANYSVEKVEKKPTDGQPKPKEPEYEFHVRPAVNRNGVAQRLAWVEPAVAQRVLRFEPSASEVERLPAHTLGSTSEEPVFSPDGKHLAYWVKATAAGKPVMTVDGVRIGKECERLHEKVAASFSPDGKSLGWVVRHDGEWCAVLDGVTQKGFDAIGVGDTRVGFTPDGSYTYLASRGGSIYWVEEVRK